MTHRARVEIVSRGERWGGEVAAVSHRCQLGNVRRVEGQGADPGWNASHPMRGAVPHKAQRCPGCHVDVWVPVKIAEKKSY